MIVYVPGRMPSHVGPYGAARYPGTLLGAIPGFYNPVSGYSNSSYYGGLGQQHQHHQHHQLHQQRQGSLDLPVWPRRMPAEEELGNSPSVALVGLGVSSPAGLGNGGPPSPAHSDSDASSSSLELGSVRRGENAQLKCRWQNCGRWFTSLEQLAGHVARLHAAPGARGLFYCGWEGCARDDNSLQDKTRFDATSPEKQSSTTHSESDKKDSSIESSNTSCSSPKASNSFEEQKSFVDWNNMYNLQDQRKEQELVQNSYAQEVKIYSKIYDDSYIIPDRIQVNPIYANTAGNTIIKGSVMSPRTSPGHVPDALPIRIGMQSTPIKAEEPMECQSKISTVDYRNIDSIVNSTPCKKESNSIGCDTIRNSVIKRAEDVKMEVIEQKLTKEETKKDMVECCCRHKCCVHNNDNILQKTKILSDLILKSQNPLFRHLLGSVDLQYGLQNMWSNIVDNTNTCGQDLRVKNENITEIEQDLPLDLTVNK
ncbi:zinc finger protein ZIC 1-like [Vespula squamosa]|uniref:Zinc finger protein ZIC 1-like n=1 Tax=Vespula squamosa TaxID=30214 RepID=A0ABD2B3C6_VESSQ